MKLIAFALLALVLFSMVALFSLAFYEKYDVYAPCIPPRPWVTPLTGEARWDASLMRNA